MEIGGFVPVRWEEGAPGTAGKFTLFKTNDTQQLKPVAEQQTRCDDLNRQWKTYFDGNWPVRTMEYFHWGSGYSLESLDHASNIETFEWLYYEEPNLEKVNAIPRLLGGLYAAGDYSRDHFQRALVGVGGRKTTAHAKLVSTVYDPKRFNIKKQGCFQVRVRRRGDSRDESPETVHVNVQKGSEGLRIEYIHQSGFEYALEGGQAEEIDFQPSDGEEVFVIDDPSRDGREGTPSAPHVRLRTTVTDPADLSITGTGYFDVTLRSHDYRDIGSVYVRVVGGEKGSEDEFTLRMLRHKFLAEKWNWDIPHRHPDTFPDKHVYALFTHDVPKLSLDDNPAPTAAGPSSGAGTPRAPGRRRSYRRCPHRGSRPRGSRPPRRW
tara:strand:- start:1102 stop:2235 length:1134 start_codon:yes stop_codon:yes gene_type:complete